MILDLSIHAVATICTLRCAMATIVHVTITTEAVRAAWRDWIGDVSAEVPEELLEGLSGHASFIEGAMEDAGLTLIKVLLLERGTINTKG